MKYSLNLLSIMNSSSPVSVPLEFFLSKKILLSLLEERSFSRNNFAENSVSSNALKRGVKDDFEICFCLYLLVSYV